MVGVIILQLIVISAIMFAIITYPPEGQPRRYDCTWVEISPDVPPKVREECRKLRSNKVIQT